MENTRTPGGPAARPASGPVSGPVGGIPYRMAFAGGWIDQPIVSRLNPEPPGSMVAVSLEPSFHWMDRCGMATSTRKVAQRLWGGELPRSAPEHLVRELYAEENRGRADPSGSQDMVGIIYPGVSRLDFDASVEGGVFPSHIETCRDPGVARWLESVVKVLPVFPRPDGYDPLGIRHLSPAWIARLGGTGRNCFDAILQMDAHGLGASMNECMLCWETLLPNVVRHPAISVDLLGLLAHYQAKSHGAMYSGCGGGYLYVVSEDPIPGAFGVDVREK